MADSEKKFSSASSDSSSQHSTVHNHTSFYATEKKHGLNGSDSMPDIGDHYLVQRNDKTWRK